MNLSLNEELIHEDFVLHVLKETVITMVTIETQILRGKGGRFLNAKVVREVEASMKELDFKVETATNISKTSVFSEKVRRVEKRSRNICDESHHVQPEIQSLFVGCTKQLEKLSEILQVCRSTVITKI